MTRKKNIVKQKLHCDIFPEQLMPKVGDIGYSGFNASFLASGKKNGYPKDYEIDIDISSTESILKSFSPFIESCISQAREFLNYGPNLILPGIFVQVDVSGYYLNRPGTLGHFELFSYLNGSEEFEAYRKNNNFPESSLDLQSNKHRRLKVKDFEKLLEMVRKHNKYNRNDGNDNNVTLFLSSFNLKKQKKCAEYYCERFFTWLSLSGEDVL